MSVEHTILRFLIDEPSHGYELQKTLTNLRNVYPLSNVNVYPVLRGLEESGFVRSASELVDSRARRVYSITDDGRAEFERWMASPLEAPLAEVRDTVLLRLSLTESDSDNDFGWLSASIEGVRNETNRMTVFYEKNHEQMTPLARLVNTELIDGLQRRCDFLERVLTEAETTPCRAAGPARSLEPRAIDAD